MHFNHTYFCTAGRFSLDEFRRMDYTGAPTSVHDFRQQQTTVNMNEEADEIALVDPVDGKFCYKKRTDGSVDKSMVVCKLCNKEFAYHRSTSSLKYHLNAKHLAASVDVSPTPSTRTHTQPHPTHTPPDDWFKDQGN